ncbi:MAG: Tellurite resistance protein TerB [Thermoleophilia bacterium]|nr:Tellurite resistance protein TerB [Thermoleophilia bacterium]
MSFLARRRARQRSGGSRRTYTYELAALHLQLLAAMAGIDDEVRSIEVEEVLAFIDRTNLAPEDIERLEGLARISVQTPPDLEFLGGQLAKLAGKPALATLLVTDLARVAAADSRADPREVALLEFVCAALDLEPVPIPIEAPAPAATAPRHEAPTPRPPRLVAQHRVRTAVRVALEASYEAGPEPFR